MSWKPIDVPSEEIFEETGAIFALGKFIGSECDKQNYKFMKCKNDNSGRPDTCLKEGREVTLCSLKMYAGSLS